MHRAMPVRMIVYHLSGSDAESPSANPQERSTSLADKIGKTAFPALSTTKYDYTCPSAGVNHNSIGGNRDVLSSRGGRAAEQRRRTFVAPRGDLA
jgi:hypothetical protein